MLGGEQVLGVEKDSKVAERVRTDIAPYVSWPMRARLAKPLTFSDVADEGRASE